MAAMAMVRPQKNKNDIQSLENYETLEGFLTSCISCKNATAQLTLVSLKRNF
jgi:hypothetical protein